MAVLELHGDEAFEMLERQWIDEAADRIRSQTSGLLIARVRFDLSFNDPAAFARESFSTLVRAEPDAPYIVALDKGHEETLGVVFGVDPNNPNAIDLTAPRRVYLVPERLRTHDRFVHVAMHELLHAFGLHHVQDGAALMAPVMVRNPPLCLHLPDVVELCRVHGCDVKRTGWCGAS